MKVDTAVTHGPGCTLSSAIAARFAAGNDTGDTVAAGVEFMFRAVRYPLDVGQEPGSVHHLAALRERATCHTTQEDVEEIVERLVEADATSLVPEVGLNIVGATPMADGTGEIAAVEGRITQTDFSSSWTESWITVSSRTAVD